MGWRAAASLLLRSSCVCATAGDGKKLLIESILCRKTLRGYKTLADAFLKLDAFLNNRRIATHPSLLLSISLNHNTPQLLRMLFQRGAKKPPSGKTK